MSKSGVYSDDSKAVKLYMVSRESRMRENIRSIIWQPLELGSLAPNLASDLAPGAPT